MWRTVAMATVLVALAGCTDDATRDIGVLTSIAPEDGIDLVESGAPTDAAMAAGEAFRLVPAGHEDCDQTVLTSGWPTTMPYNSEVSAQCIIDAANAGAPAQYAFWGRDGIGGIIGTVIRVNGVDDITFVDFTVDAVGNIGSFDTPCSELATTPFDPPTCASQ